IAVSAHAPRDLEGLAGLAAFAVFGPIRDTPSKRAYGPPVGLEALRAGAARGVPLLAIGGLTVGGRPQIIGAGAPGPACVRPLRAPPRPPLVWPSGRLPHRPMTALSRYRIGLDTICNPRTLVPQFPRPSRGKTSSTFVGGQ